MRRACAVLSGMCVVALVAALCGTASALPTIDELMGKMQGKMTGMTTFEADIKMTVSQGERKMTSNGHLVSKNILKDDKTIAKTLMNYKSSMDMGEMKMDMQMVNDGEYIWVESKNSMMPRVMVMKTKPGKAVGERNPLDNVKQMWDTWDLKVTGEDTIDGQKMWVLEGTVKEGKQPMGKMTPTGAKVKMWLGQDDLFTHRMIVYDDKDAPVAQTDFSNIKLNGTVDDNLFNTTPPPGAQIMDMEKMPKGGPMGGPGN